MDTIKIRFDVNHNPVIPTFLLSTRYGTILGKLSNISDLHLSDNINDAATIGFQVSKYDNGVECPQWDELVDLKLLYCIEWDAWFQIRVQLSDTESLVKTVDCVHLYEAELSQTLLHGVEINTETDIARDEYQQTYPYVVNNPKASLFDRVLEKVPHYKIVHVDDSIKNIRRIYTFEFDNISIKDALDQIAEEIGCLIVYGERVNEDEYTPVRSISIYDLQQTCKNCGNRGDFNGTCPECGSTDIIQGYGKDTTIFISKDNLSEDITYAVDVDAVKNCFKLQAGDDLMTAVIAECNPNGSEYIWDISPLQEEDMPDELLERLRSYDALYQTYQRSYEMIIDPSGYNTLIDKYQKYDEELQKLDPSVLGYSNLVNAYYDVLDLHDYLQTTLMPNIKLQDTTAKEQALLLVSTLSSVAVSNFNIASKTTIDSNVLSAARVIIDPRYKVEIKSSSYNKPTWTGIFTLSNYSDPDEDKADSIMTTIAVDGNYESYVNQLAQRALKKGDTKDYSISGLFKSENFADELKKYSLDMLRELQDCCNGCLTVLQEQGASATNSQKDVKGIYENYYSKMQSIESEIAVRESEVKILEKLEASIESEMEKVHQALDFQDYIGKELWDIFLSYRREDLYSNSNYISDGLTNAELIENAKKFIKSASEELYKSSHLQHTISSSLKNLLVIKEFSPLLEYFQLGNWIRIEIDGTIYKLRLVSYEIDFESLEVLDVEFSDIAQTATGVTDVQDILEQAGSMATSYGSTQKQAWKGKDSYDLIRNWFHEGLDATLTNIVNNASGQTQVWDEHGMLFRKLDEVTNEYLPTAMKIINSTLVLTTDNWESTKTAVGEFIYQDPVTGEFKTGYGINGETIVGRLILGETLGIYNEGSTLTFNTNGLTVTNDKNTFSVNPNAESIVTVKKGYDNLLSLDTDGNLEIVGAVTATVLNATQQGRIGCWVITRDRMYNNDNLSGYTGVNKYGTGQAFWAGGADLAGNNAPFRVSHTGLLVTENIIANVSGNIAGWNITDEGMKYSTNDYEVHVMPGTNPNKDFLVVHDKKTNRYPFYVRVNGVTHTENLEVFNATLSGAVTAEYLSVQGKLYLHGTDYFSNNSDHVVIEAVKSGNTSKVYFGNDFCQTIIKGSSLSLSVPSISVATVEASDALKSNAWICPSYGGGWYMSDDTHIRAYNDKNVFTGGNIVASNEIDTQYGNIYVGVSSYSSVGVYFGGETSGNRPFVYNASGSGALWLQTYDSGWKWYNMGAQFAQNTSDKRLKDNIVDSRIEALPAINSMKLRAFTRNDSSRYYKIGFVADELEQVDSLLVDGGGYTPEGHPVYKTVNTLQLLSYTVKGIQELSSSSNGHSNRIGTLEAQVPALEERLREALIRIDTLNDQIRLLQATE